MIECLHGRKFSALGYLVRASDGAGNLGFSSDRDNLCTGSHSVSAVPLEPLAQAVENLDREARIDVHLRPALPALYPGIGGARPKVTVYRDGAHWIAKFPSARDSGPISNPRLEFFGLTLARQCGINTVQ